MKDRRALAQEEVVTVLAIVDADTGELAEPPEFLIRGFVHAGRLRDRRSGRGEEPRLRRTRRHRRGAPARANDHHDMGRSAHKEVRLNSYALSCGGHLDGVAGKAAGEDVGVLLMEAVLEVTLDPDAAGHGVVCDFGHTREPHPSFFA
jgi:hypothetical protein